MFILVIGKMIKKMVLEQFFGLIKKLSTKDSGIRTNKPDLGNWSGKKSRLKWKFFSQNMKDFSKTAKETELENFFTPMEKFIAVSIKMT